MDNKLIVTDEGEQDLIEIYLYVSRYSVSTARKRIMKIYKRFDLLQLWPEMGTRLSSRFDVQYDYRYVICLRKYIIIYENSDGIIFIHRIFDCRTDFIKKLS